MRVTKQLLEEHNTCEDQLIIFESEWPNGVNLTPNVLRRALEIGLNLRWFVNHVLPASVRDDYNKTMDAAINDYNNAQEHAERIFKADTVSLKDERYHKYKPEEELLKNTAQNDFTSRIDSAKRDLEDVSVSAFMTALNAAEKG